MQIEGGGSRGAPFCIANKLQHVPTHRKNNLASPSPVTDGERLYAWFGTGQIVALTLEG